MDINILFALQEFRNGAGEFLAEFLSKMTFLGEKSTVLVIMAIIYWCVNKEFGKYFLMGICGTRILNGFLKVTACVYRPWIRDARIIPHGNSLETAAGYSFPSGHCTNAGTLYGGGTIRKELPRIIRIFLAVILVFVAFSRIYLGVHTPQDILAGSLLSLLVMWLTIKLIQWIKVHPDKDIVVMLSPGDTVFLYTDGVTEAMVSPKEQFGIDRMFAVLNRNIQASPEQIVKNVIFSITEFVNGAEQSDDITCFA